MAYASFYGCTNVIEEENGISYIDKWILRCDLELESVILRSDSVGIVDEAFYGCDKLTSIEIPNSVKSIGKQAFYDCTSLSSIIISDSVTSIGDRVFGNCAKLTSIEIPSSVINIGMSAFVNCEQLEIIIFEGIIADVREMDFFVGYTIENNGCIITCSDGNIYNNNGEIMWNYYN